MIETIATYWVGCLPTLLSFSKTWPSSMGPSEVLKAMFIEPTPTCLNISD